MRVCVVGTRGFPHIEGGVEKHCEALYPLLAKDMEIILFRRKPYVVDDCTYKNIRFVDLPSTKIKGVETVLHSFLATIYAILLRPDVVHYHNIGPALFMPFVKLFSIPAVLTYHSPNYEHKKWGVFGRNLLRFCERVAFRFADRILFVNCFQMEKCPGKIREKSEYIPNGIGAVEPSSQRDYLDQIGVEPGKYVLSVGRITPEKGFHTLIQGFKEQNLPYKLVIAGGVEFETGYMTRLQALCADSPVVFTGFVQGEALAQLYSHAALFVLTSENEGFPLVLLEAMGYKRNVLVSDIPATHLVALSQEDYFPVGDVKTLAEKITRKLQEPSCRDYDLDAYDWQKIADRVSSVLEEVTDCVHK